jgi:hypothetical protein
VRPGGSQLGGTVRSRERLTEALERGPPDIREDDTVGSSGGTRVQEHRQPVAVGQPSPEPLRELDAGGHGRVADRHEGSHVECADAWMPAVLASQVDAGDSLRGQRAHRIEYLIGGTREREHAAVVIRVRGPVEQPDARHRADGPGARVDDLDAPALADVGDALDQVHAGQHGRPGMSRTRPRADPIGYHPRGEPT